ncbi:MAG: AI-2E family transporter [Oscillospiraceae bacterium]|nr:AI-2E family transporter [Oscillospiraceae bacterium]
MFKFHWDSKYFTVSLYAFGVLAGAILFWFGIGEIAKKLTWLGEILRILQPVFNGLILAYIINPVLIGLEKLLKKILWQKKLPLIKNTNVLIRGLAVFFSWFIIITACIFMIAVLIPCINANLVKISSNSNKLIADVNNWMAHIEHSLNLETGTLSTQVSSTLQKWQITITDNLQHLLPQLLNFTKQIGVKIANIFVACVISIYVLFHKERFCAQVKKLLSAYLKIERVKKLNEIVLELNSIFNSFMFGKFLNSIIIGSLCYIGMLILRLPYSVFISVTIGISNIIPYFGPFIGAIPSCLILMLESPIKAFTFSIFIIFLQQFDSSIIGPKILGDKTGLTGFWVLFAIILFGGLFGIIGMVLGVPIFATFYVFIKRIIERKLTQKGLSPETTAYLTP